MSECLEMVKVISFEQLREKRHNWVEASRDNNFEGGIKQLLTDLYPDNAHFIYELLQNAEDPHATVVRFTLSDSDVEFEHNGEKLFSLEDICSITSIGASNKRDDPTSIGKFGVGFKAVFAYTNIPEIHSGGFHFRIHDLVVPETDRVPRPKMGEQETRFIFPFNNPKKPGTLAVKEVERGLRALGDNTLLFLSHIRKIEYLLPDGSLGSLERLPLNDGRIEIRASQPGKEETISHWLRFEDDVEVTDEDGKIKLCRIAIAYRLAEENDKKGVISWKIVPLDHGQVSIYFPAEKEASNLRFHVHAPFASTVARDSVRDCAANNALRDRLAALVVKSLTVIRDRGMLTVAFLAVLPTPQDNLPGFYEPIREEIVEAFKSKALTPTKTGAHAPAGELYRGPARIQEVLDDDDLSLLTPHEAPLWAKNPPQENQREAHFLNSLEIEAWGWSELAEAVSKPHIHPFYPQQLAENAQHKNFIENWVTQKEDIWLLRFYALLGEANDTHGESVAVDDLRIIRVASDDVNSHVESGKAYFSPEDDTSAPPSDVLFVKQSVYAAGRSEPQKKSARSFLEHSGVRPYDAKAGLERILEKYSTGHTFPVKTNTSHVKQFVSYWQENQNSTKMFSTIAFLIGEEESRPCRYFNPSDLYLDSPYIETGLAALFIDSKLHVEKPKIRLSANYRSIKKFEEFAVALGVMSQLELCTHKATEMQKDFFKKRGNETASTIDEDYFINGLLWHIKSSHGFIADFDLSACKSLALSRAIWSVMCGTDPKVLVARYMPNEKRRNEEKRKSSFLVDYLADNSWVPDKDGNFLQPAEVTRQTLHLGFKFDDRNGWLTAIGFGENTRKRSEEYQSRNRDAQKLGFSSADEAEEFAKLKKEGLTPAVIRTSLIQRKQTDQPTQSVPDPERRRKNVLDNTADAPSKESVQRERSLQKGVTEVTAQARAYLRAKYSNSDGELVCQCCRKEMPFKLRSGEHYFEAIQCIGDKDIRHYQNRLALCPTCAAMYQHARETDDAEIRRRIIAHTADDQAPAVEIPIRLASREYTLRFVGTHWFDLKTVLGRTERT